MLRKSRATLTCAPFARALTRAGPSVRRNSYGKSKWQQIETSCRKKAVVPQKDASPISNRDYPPSNRRKSSETSRLSPCSPFELIRTWPALLVLTLAAGLRCDHWVKAHGTHTAQTNSHEIPATYQRATFPAHIPRGRTYPPCNQFSLGRFDRAFSFSSADGVGTYRFQACFATQHHFHTYLWCSPCSLARLWLQQASHP